MQLQKRTVYRHQDAIQVAENIAELINSKSNSLARTSLAQQPPLARFMTINPLMSACPAPGATVVETSSSTLKEPAIHEMLIFGSLANQQVSYVEDIDLMILDNGYYSAYFCDPQRNKSYNARGYSVYKNGEDSSGLRNNIVVLLGEFFGLSPKEINALVLVPVDLHVLPIELLTQSITREHLAAREQDPRFFQNAFERFMRFYPIRQYHNEAWKQSNIEVMEEKYEISLTDLHHKCRAVSVQT